MLAEFSLPGGTAHAHVFDGPAETGQFVSLEMGHADKGVGLDDVGGNGNGLKMFFINGHFDGGFPLESVGDDQGSADGLVGKAVFQGRLQMGNAFGPGAHIEGVGIGDEGFTAPGLDLVGKGSQIDGTDIGRIALFPEMDLDGHQVVLGQGSGKGHLVQQLADPLQPVFFQRSLQIDEIYG